MKRKLLRFIEDKKRVKLAAITAISLLLCVGLAVGQRSESTVRAKQGANQQTTVEVLKVSPANLFKRISLTGQTVPEAQVDIAAKYQGKVVSVAVNLGQRIEAGQVLLVQDTADADISIRQNQAAYLQAANEAVTNQAAFRANHERAQADYQRAAAGYERYKTLYDAGAVSREQLDASRQQMADAKAAFAALADQMNGGVAASIQAAQAAAMKAQHNLNAVEKQRSDLVLTAPRGGVIGYRQVEAGNLVQAGQKLLSIVDNSNIYVDCQISEQDLPAISLGMPVEVQIESLGRKMTGKVIYLSPASDAASLTFTLRIALDKPDAMLKGGMFAKTVISSLLRENVMVVPKEAVVDKNGKSYLFVVQDDDKVAQCAVEVGARGDQNVEIISGISAGQRIAVNNLARLRPGMLIVQNEVTLESRGAAE